MDDDGAEAKALVSKRILLAQNKSPTPKEPMKGGVTGLTWA